MRHLPEKPPPRKGTEYRIRYPVGDLFRLIMDTTDSHTTAYPGIIKNNKPKAERVLKMIQENGKPTAFIEVRSINPDTEWKILDAQP